MRMLFVTSLALACSKPAAEQKPEHKPAAESTAPAAATGSSAAVDPQLVRFCALSYFKMMDCFKDEEFWEVFATMYFANTRLAADDVERKHWVGMLKEDILKLYQEKGFEANCQAALEHNKAPSPSSMKLVNEARAKSCAAFGNAFGYMVFHEGALHQPK
jgi:hypothetical protein